MAQKNRANMLTDIVSNIYNNLINFITGQNAQDRFVNLLDSSPNILSDASQPNGYVSTDANNEMFSSYYDEEISRADLITDLTANLAVGGKFYRINDAVGSTITLLVIAESNLNLYPFGIDATTGEVGVYDITTDVFSPVIGSGNASITPITVAALTTLQSTSAIATTTIYLITDASPFVLAAQFKANNQNVTTATIMDNAYAGTVLYTASTGVSTGGRISDANGNVWNGTMPSATTLGASSVRNTFEQDCSLTAGTGFADNVVKSKATGYIFGNGLIKTTIEAGPNGADYTNLTNFSFLYGNSAPCRIFNDGTNNYHWKDDPANNRIIQTLMVAPYTVSYIGGSTGGGITKATAAGVDTYTATVSGVASYTDGDAYLIRFTNGNTTAATLNINSLGAKSLYRNNDGAIIGGDIWDGGEMLCIYNSTLNAFQCIGTSPNSIFAYVTNDDSVTITKGQVVYAFGGTGDRMTVKLANNTSDATSARTVGVVLSASIAANQKGIIILQGLLDGLSILPTSTYADGDSIYLGATAGSITNVKQYAPNHLVYVATVTTASNGSAGRMYVRVQNGYELDELHNVQAQSPTLNDTLYYDNLVSPPQWKTASIATILGYTPMTNPMTTGGDVIYGGASGVPTRLANGSAGQILQSNGTTLAPSWVAAPSGTNTYAFNVISQTLVAPADATSYLFGLTVEIPASANLRREFKFPQAGTMTAFSFNLLQSTNGSNETCTLYLRNTSTSTDYTIGTFTSDFGPNGALKTLYSGLSIAVNTTDNWVVKILTPTWGTNPANWIPVGIITITT
jgi:hypothetical protein